jgi:hypothetical protein
MKSTFVGVVGVLGTCLVFIFCSCGGGELDQYGCRSDSDCKHGRICVNGSCQNSGGTCQSDGECPSGQHCYNNQCRVCDADSDNVFGADCSGADCDDQNGAVHPGADELCGDGLDNDCDGVTDPESLCENCAGVICPPGYACDPDTGVCVPICTPNCTDRECGPDGCGGSCGTCPDGYYCDRTGLCAVGCRDRCDPGERSCVGNAVIHCEDTNGDGCVEWSTPSTCPENYKCADGECVGCDPDCDGKECGDDGCGGSCGECEPDLHCENYRCVPGCQDECWWDEFYCMSQREYVVCGQYDDDPCTEFSPPQRCPRGTRCSEREMACVSDTCEDECYAGQTQCLDEWTYMDCGQYDNDPCLEWGYPIPCPPETRCDWMTGYCSAPTCELDEFEPDDLYRQATQLSPNMAQTHSICPIGDRDWWVFRLSAIADIVLETSGSHGDSVMWLYDANLSELDFNDDHGFDLWSRITRRGLPMGTYYVQVAAYDNYEPIDYYILTLFTLGSCTPECTGRQCGPDGCGGICGTCPAGTFCNADGQCVQDGHRRGAGDPCGFYQGCPVDWSAAWTCIEYPGQLNGFCSYPCMDADDCVHDFPNGCCRELVEGYSVCLPPELCVVDHPGHLEECEYSGLCLPDMFCLDMPDTNEQLCIFTCDTAMSVCPADGTCIATEDGASTGFCLPSGDGEFADPCSLSQGCQSGLLCTQLVEDHPGYCNRLCSDLLPCLYPFDCLLEDGQGGRWCAATCTQDTNCSMLGDWICYMEAGDWGVCVPAAVP